MMLISWSPQRSDATLTVDKDGEKLTINGQMFDFSVIPEGATLPGSAVNCEFVVGEVTRESGQLHVTLLLPHGLGAPPEITFPADLIDPPDGRFAVPGQEG